MIFRTCIFCLAFDESFTEDNLDLHYWKDCPMLIRCGNCNQVIQVCVIKTREDNTQFQLSLAKPEEFQDTTGCRVL